MGWDFFNGEYLVLLVYNVFGECIIVSGVCGFEDGIENLFYLLDVVYIYYLDFNIIVKFKFQNLLGEDKEIE